MTELIARVPLSSGADMLEVVLRELERIFLEDGGLADARPGVRISVSRPARYLELAAASGHVCTARAEATLARECGHDPIAAATFGREAVERRTKDCV